MKRSVCAAQGLDILIGVAETHGRQETAALLAGLRPSLPGVFIIVVVW